MTATSAQRQSPDQHHDDRFDSAPLHRCSSRTSSLDLIHSNGCAGCAFARNGGMLRENGAHAAHARENMGDRPRIFGRIPRNFEARSDPISLRNTQATACAILKPAVFAVRPGSLPRPARDTLHKVGNKSLNGPPSKPLICRLYSDSYSRRRGRKRCGRRAEVSRRHACRGCLSGAHTSLSRGGVMAQLGRSRVARLVGLGCLAIAV